MREVGGKLCQTFQVAKLKNDSFWIPSRKTLCLLIGEKHLANKKQKGFSLLL